MEPESSRPEALDTEDPLHPAPGNWGMDGTAAEGVTVDVIFADPAWRRLLPRAEALARRAATAALAREPAPAASSPCCWPTTAPCGG